MKKTYNEIYFLGTVKENFEITKDYYWNQKSKNLSCWVRTKGNPEVYMKTVPTKLLPIAFHSLFDSEQNIITDERPLKPYSQTYL